VPDERRKPGRPPLDPAGSCALSFRISTKEFDRLCAEATRERLTLAEVVRRALRSRRARPDDPAVR